MTHERVPIFGMSDSQEFVEDFERYRFASRYVAGKRVVDLACGTGYGAEMLVRDGKAIVVYAIDASHDAIMEAAAVYRSRAIKFLTGTAERIPLPDASVDVAVSMETFEHLRQPQRLLEEFRRVLVPNGLLVISTPRNDTESRLQPDNPFHVREYSAAEFRQSLEGVFPSIIVWSQFVDYTDDTPAALGAPDSFIRKVGRAVIWTSVRRKLRRAVGSRGRARSGSRIVEGEDARAAYQIAVCHSG